MLPAMHQAWEETTGALWSSRTITASPWSRVVRDTPAGIEGSGVEFSGLSFITGQGSPGREQAWREVNEMRGTPGEATPADQAGTGFGSALRTASLLGGR